MDQKLSTRLDAIEAQNDLDAVNMSEAEAAAGELTEWPPACKLSRRSASTASAAPINSCKGMSIRLLLAVALLLELELFGLDPAEAEAA